MPQAFERLQVEIPPAPQNPRGVINQQALQQVPQPIREPRISLPEKFDGTQSKFRDFINQIQLIFWLQPQQYPTETSQVSLIGTFLSGAALSWFILLLEKKIPLF
jgi:hypothetical protein